MDADELRELQAPIKQRYRETPEAAVVTLRAAGRLDEAAIACNVEAGRALTAAGLHPASGGDGSFACSGDMLLEALVACAGVTLKAVATALGVSVEGGVVTAEGDLDFRGTLGVDKHAPGGLPRYSAAFRTRYRRTLGSYRNVAAADGALLRGPADATQSSRPLDLHHTVPAREADPNG
jgi:hypothetical protein